MFNFRSGPSSSSASGSSSAFSAFRSSLSFSSLVTLPSSSYPLEPCPFCQLRLKDEYSLVLHIEKAHAEHGGDQFRPENSERPDALDYDESIVGRNHPEDHFEEECRYIACPEGGCEEHILLAELQNHMDFHSAEDFNMETTQTQIQKQALAQMQAHPQDRTRHHHHQKREHKKREHGAERRREKEADSQWDRPRDLRERHNVNYSHHTKEHRSRREVEKNNEVMVSFAAPATPKRTPVKGLGWLERAALAIVPHPTVSQESKRPEKRFSDIGKRIESKRVEIRRGMPRRDSFERTSKNHSKIRKHSKTTVTTTTAPAPKPNGSHIGAIKKLGKSDLGPYANETQMPDWLRIQLEKGGKAITVRKIDPTTGHLMNVVQIANETPDLISTIALLSGRDRYVARAWLCHPATKHIGKQLSKEGGFCGYRNIQMLISYIQAVYPRGSHPFEGRIPTILKLQDYIEAGWDRGINSSARAETGGIKGTRKYIGTSEAQTFFTTVGIRCRARPFHKTDGRQTQFTLLTHIEEYFKSGSPSSSDTYEKVTITSKAPIYLQHSGHSMTIIGLEKWTDGTSSLLVFDPFFSPTESIKSIAGQGKLSSRIKPAFQLKVYRRKMNYLQKYREFEIIMLDQ